MMFFLKKYAEQTECYGCGLTYKMCDLQYDTYMDGWYCYQCTDEVVCAGCGNEYNKNQMEYLPLYNAHYCKYCKGDD